MVETATRHDPLDGVAVISVRSRLTIEALPPSARFVLRGPQDAADALGKALGFTLPSAINRALAQGDKAALKLGPDEWLIVAPLGEEPPYDIIAAAGGALVDVGQRNVAIGVAGSLAADILNSGCPLDLDEAAFPVGMATRTVFSKAEIVLWRTAPESFRIDVWRSFSPYIHGLLTDAAREYMKG